VRIVAPLPFCGTSGAGAEAPLKAKSWLFVTRPPPSARPPQLNRRTWLPAARRGSKFRQAFV
jgi:hypothetical protein